MSVRVAYHSKYDADAAREYLAAFGIVTDLHELPTDDGVEGWIMWEVEAHGLPLPDAVVAPRVVEGTTEPARTEVDEHDMGKSTWWDREWERDRGY